jgi:hypothetical protein
VAAKNLCGLWVAAFRLPANDQHGDASLGQCFISAAGRLARDRAARRGKKALFIGQHLMGLLIEEAEGNKAAASTTPLRFDGGPQWPLDQCRLVHSPDTRTNRTPLVCPLLAQSGHVLVRGKCPLLGAKRTLTWTLKNIR